jgi:hypothetical protein
MCVHQQVVQQVEELVLEHFAADKELLDELDVHADCVVQDFD